MSPIERTFGVVVNWNGGPSNLRCLESLVDGGVRPEHIVFVDNASDDGSRALVEERFPGLIFRDNPDNLGFGRAANQGATLALEHGADLIAFLNNDAWYPPGALALLAEVLKGNPRVGMVGPRVLLPGEPPRLWAAGGIRGGGPNLSTLRGHQRRDGDRWHRTVTVDYVPGCALVVSRAAWQELGGFEERYFAYMEDVELGARATEAGWSVLCVGEAHCFHESSSSTGGGYNPRRKYMNGVNAVHFLRSHGRPMDWARLVVFDVATLPLAWVVGVARGRGRAVAAKALGLWHGALGRSVHAEQLAPGGTRLW